MSRSTVGTARHVGTKVVEGAADALDEGEEGTAARTREWQFQVSWASRAQECIEGLAFAAGTDCFDSVAATCVGRTSFLPLVFFPLFFGDDFPFDRETFPVQSELIPQTQFACPALIP